MSFKYDNNGIRTKKTVNGVDTEYFYVGDTLVSQKTGNETINFAYTAGGAPLGFTYNGTPYYYMLNLQGDIVAEYTYDAWGKLISISGTLADTIGVKNPLRYRGYYYDTETGFYYLQSRYYDSETSRFINADAYLIAGDDLIQGTNMYAYCYNNPVMYVDPTGYAYDPVFDTYDSSLERIISASVSLAIACGAVQYIIDYGINMGYSEDQVTASLTDFLSRTKPLYDDVFELRGVLMTGISVMTGEAKWMNLYSDASLISDVAKLLKQNFFVDLGIKGAASMGISIIADMIPEFLNPLNSNIDLVAALGKHAFSAMGGMAITASGFALTSALVAVNPPIGLVVGSMYIVGGNWAWNGIIDDM